MTEEEHIKLIKVGDSFWESLGILVAQHVAQLPENIEPEVVMYLQEMCSIYGTKYKEYLIQERLNNEFQSKGI